MFLEESYGEIDPCQYLCEDCVGLGWRKVNCCVSGVEEFRGCLGVDLSLVSLVILEHRSEALTLIRFWDSSFSIWAFPGSSNICDQ